VIDFRGVILFRSIGQPRIQPIKEIEITVLP
jgi:hypothetical protein